MILELQQKDHVSELLSHTLTGMLFGATASLLIYVSGLALACVAFWWRSQDIWILAAAGTGVLLSAYRVTVFFRFKRRNRKSDCVRSNTCWTLAYAIGAWCFSLDMAGLLIRTIMVGDMLLIALAAVVLNGFLMGLLMRAARPLFAVPSLLLLFLPVSVAAACAPDKGFLAVALLLVVYCAASVAFVLRFQRAIKARILAEHQLSLVAVTDHLTGLANRGGLVDHSKLLLEKAQSTRCGYALALIDLDGFKSVNDTYGHGTGDELLREVSTRIKAVLGGSHFAARLGGDEFAIVFDPDTALDNVIVLGNEIVSSLGRPFDLGATLQISASVGIAILDGQADTFASIMERADKALYLAKNAGRNQVQVMIAPNCSPSIVSAEIDASTDAMLRGTPIVVAKIALLKTTQS